MDCFSCKKKECVMKTRMGERKPCYYCKFAIEPKISDICVFCMVGKECFFRQREGVGHGERV
nr:MAG TPA: hypothetical protein [Caudoviricetes sp.]